jgi:hypothetical protein
VVGGSRSEGRWFVLVVCGQLAHRPGVHVQRFLRVFASCASVPFEEEGILCCCRMLCWHGVRVSELLKACILQHGVSIW